MLIDFPYALKPVGHKVGNPHGHACVGIEWQVLKTETAIQIAHTIVERMGQYAKAADLPREAHRGGECEEHQGSGNATPLIMHIDSQLSKKQRRDGIGPVALGRFWQMRPFYLRCAKADESGNFPGRTVADNIGSRRT